MLLLIDSQGLFDNQIPHKCNQIIFCLSSLLSSVQIFNLKEKLDKNKLHFINLFSELASGDFAHKKEEEEEKPFQVNKLVIHMGNWQIF